MKLKTRLACLCQLTFIPRLNTRKITANRVFNSVLTYCMPLSGGIDDQDLNHLKVLQNRAVQLVALLPPRSSRNIIFDLVGWITVRQLIFNHSAMSVLRVRNTRTEELGPKLHSKWWQEWKNNYRLR